jgi:hypothetical protein
MPGAALRRGTRLLGYRIEALVGRGGMGVVYRVYDPRLKRNVALKLVAPELSDDGHFRERFLAEIEVAASLDHPNVIPIYDAGEVDGQFFLAMRYVEGSDLKTLLTEGALETARALTICSQVADALDHAHERGLVHRDVKPSNVLLDPREHVYLADFGLSRRISETGIPAGPGPSLGTPAYAAPEQIQGGDVDARADVYSLGCVLYECLTGDKPFERESELAMLWAHLQEPPPKASEHEPGLPVEIDAVIATALAKDADNRYAGCSELIEAAADALGVAAPARRPFWSRRAVVAVLALALVAAAAGIWAVVQRGSSNTVSSASLGLASAAQAQRAAHPELALLLGLEAVRAQPTAEAKATMIAALERARNLGVRTILNARAGPVSDVAFSPDGAHDGVRERRHRPALER